MEIEVEFTRDELYRATSIVGRISFRQFKSTRTYKVLAALSISVLVAFGASAMSFIYRSRSYDYISFLLMIALFVAYTFLFRYITVEFYRFIVYNSKRYAGPVGFKLDDEYLYVRDGWITSRFGLGSFYMVEDTDEFTFLFIDIHQAVIIPKKTGAAREFVALVREKVRLAAG